MARVRQRGGDAAPREAKECAHRLSQDVWETVTAFASTEGGTLILGLSESKGFSPAPDFDIDRVRDQFLSGMGDGGSRGRLANPPYYSIERVMFQGSPLLLITIDELDLSHSPCYIVGRSVQGGSYKRVDDTDVSLSANETYSLETADVLTASDRQIVDDTFDSDLNEDLLSQAFKKARAMAPRALRGTNTPAVKMLRLGFTVRSCR